MNYSEQLAESLAKILSQAPFQAARTPGQIQDALEVPRNRELGDLAFPCFTLSKELKKNPAQIAGELGDAVRAELDESRFDRVAATGPYLNVGIATSDFASQLMPRLQDGSFLAQRSPTGQRVMIEYSQPNTHKAFHVGHMRNVALGDSLVRICEWVGDEVVAANYIGDEGAHIAKCLWYYRNHFDGEVPETNRGEFLGELYTNATELLDFTTLTRSPHPHVVTAKVTGIEAVPESKRNAVVQLDSGTSNETVVCGGTGYEVGDIVPYARPGARINGRLVESAERNGVVSNGMICSQKEIGLGDDAAAIHVFPEDTALGIEIAELLRLPGALPNEVPVLTEMKSREQGVSDVLKALESGEPELTKLWMETRQWSLDEFNSIYDWLGARFDHFFYESEVGEAGKNIVNDSLEKGVLVRSEGAVGADLSEFKMPFFLLLRSDGTGLYSTKDIALARDKFEQFKIDRSIYVVDVSQSLHFQQVFKTLELMGFEQATRCEHLAYGMVVLPDGKMGSRFGNVILFSELRARLIARIREEYLDQYQGDWSDEEIAESAKRIAIATIRYGMLNQSNNKDIVFDLKEWTSQSGNTGPYLLYAYARIQSILAKLGAFDSQDPDWSLLQHPLEGELLRHIARFPEVVSEASTECQPQLVCVFLYELAKSFSRFFDKCHVKNAETAELRLVRGLLVRSVGEVLKRGLSLLGIETAERM